MSEEISIKNPSNSKKVLIHKCPYDGCEYETRDKSNFNRHVKSKHLNLLPYSCTECNKSFNRKDCLDLHVRTLHLVGFPCKFCRSILISEENLNRHIKAWHYESVSREQRIAWDKEEFGPNVSSDS